MPPQYLWRRDALTGSAPIRMLFSTTSDAGRSRQASSAARYGASLPDLFTMYQAAARKGTGWVAVDGYRDEH